MYTILHGKAAFGHTLCIYAFIFICNSHCMYEMILSICEFIFGLLKICKIISRLLWICGFVFGLLMICLNSYWSYCGYVDHIQIEISARVCGPTFLFVCEIVSFPLESLFPISRDGVRASMI